MISPAPSEAPKRGQLPQEQPPSHNKGSNAVNMLTWADVEDFMAYWHRKANETAWRDLHDTRGTMEYLTDPVPHRCLSMEYLTSPVYQDLEEHSILCETCINRADLVIWLEERATLIADDLRPELRLRAANVSTRQSQG